MPIVPGPTTLLHYVTTGCSASGVLCMGELTLGCNFIEDPQQIGREGHEQCLRLRPRDSDGRARSAASRACRITGIRLWIWANEFVRLGGEDGKGRIGMAAGIVYCAPDASKGKRFPALEGHPVEALYSCRRVSTHKSHRLRSGNVCF